MAVHTQAGWRELYHFPLIVNADTYGYSAKVAGEGGCSLPLISRTDYLQHLRRSVEREMNETVTFLKDAQFFSAWTEYAMSRLYFCFEKAKIPEETDIVTQGDEADFCFIVKSASAVLVKLKEGEEGRVPEPEKEVSSPEASPATRRSRISVADPSPHTSRPSMAGIPMARASVSGNDSPLPRLSKMGGATQAWEGATQTWEGATIFPRLGGRVLPRRSQPSKWRGRRIHG